jgi:hypothetical protein
MVDGGWWAITQFAIERANQGCTSALLQTAREAPAAFNGSPLKKGGPKAALRCSLADAQFWS